MFRGSLIVLKSHLFSRQCTSGAEAGAKGRAAVPAAACKLLFWRIKHNTVHARCVLLLLRMVVVMARQQLARSVPSPSRLDVNY